MCIRDRVKRVPQDSAIKVYQSNQPCTQAAACKNTCICELLIWNERTDILPMLRILGFFFFSGEASAQRCSMVGDVMSHSSAAAVSGSLPSSVSGVSEMYTSLTRYYLQNVCRFFPLKCSGVRYGLLTSPVRTTQNCLVLSPVVLTSPTWHNKTVLLSLQLRSHCRCRQNKTHRNWVEARQNSSKLGRDETKLSCRRCEQANSYI